MKQEFEETLTGLGFIFNPDNTLKDRFVSKSDLIELMEFAFNLGLDVASENAEADYHRPDEQTIECYVLRGSILKHKL